MATALGDKAELKLVKRRESIARKRLAAERAGAVTVLDADGTKREVLNDDESSSSARDPSSATHRGDAAAATSDTGASRRRRGRDVGRLVETPRLVGI